MSDLNPTAKPFTLACSGASYQRKATLAVAHQQPTKRSGRHSVTQLSFEEFSKDGNHDIASFLRFLRLHKYIETVTEANITLEQLRGMDEVALAEIFPAAGARNRVLNGIARYHEFLGGSWEVTVSDSDSSLSTSPKHLAPSPLTRRHSAAFASMYVPIPAAAPGTAAEHDAEDDDADFEINTAVNTLLEFMNSDDE